MPITSGYTESEAFYNPILWYDRPQAGLKRSAHQAALDAYNMMDTCGYYHHLQAPSVKYMKPEPVTYYHYADDAERYQSSIAAVSGQNQVHSTFSSGSYTPSHYASYSTAGAAVYNSLSTDSSNGFNLGHHVPSQVTHASDPPAVSPAQPSQEANITAPLTPPLSVSPVGAESPAPHSRASNPNLPHTSGYQDDAASTYHHRSGTTSPQHTDCDSTTHSDHYLSEGELIPKLPLHVLSDLSEGLPLPGEFMHNQNRIMPHSLFLFSFQGQQNQTLPLIISPYHLLPSQQYHKVYRTATRCLDVI